MKKNHKANTPTRRGANRDRYIPLPDDAEWLFHRVKDDEAPVCMLYEYGRQSEAFKKRVEAWRRQHLELIECGKRLFEVFADTARPPKERSLAAAQWFCARLAANSAKGMPPSISALYPGGLAGDDPRTFLFYFDSFPTVPWQKIEPEQHRKLAYEFYGSPGENRTQDVEVFLLTLRKDYSDLVDAQQALQSHAGSPMDRLSTDSMVRNVLKRYLYAPALQTGASGCLLPISGVEVGADGKWVKSLGVVHSQELFTINWAKSNNEILTEFGEWLKRSPGRPHDDLKISSCANAREYLRWLTALRYKRLKGPLNPEAVEGKLAEAASRDREGALKKQGVYSEDSAYRRAAKKANELVLKIFV